MREIKFRGRRIDADTWIYGLPHKDYAGDWVISDGVGTWDVDPDSIGQFTGLKDKNGREIYEGDRVKRGVHDFNRPGKTKPEISEVIYVSHGFKIKAESFGWEGEGLWDWSQVEVIGTIHDKEADK